MAAGQMRGMHGFQSFVCRAAMLALSPVVFACGADDAVERRDTGGIADVAPDIGDTAETADTDEIGVEEVAEVAEVEEVEEVEDVEVAVCPSCGPLARCDDPSVGCVCEDPVNTRLVGSRCYPLDFVDPDLDRDPDGAWEVSGQNVQHDVNGQVDPGSWRVLLGSLSQVLDVPPSGTVPKLAVDLYGASFLDSGLWDFATGEHAVALPTPGFDIRVPTRQCLGEAGYGEGVLFSVIASFVSLDRITLVTDETCPDPGVLRDGDFDGGEGWRLERGAALTIGAVTEGDPGLSLPVDDPCTPARATQRISVPLAGANALRFKARTDPSTTLGVTLRDRFPASASVRTDGRVETVSFCFTAFERGMVMPLTFVPLVPTGAACVPGFGGHAAVDEVELFVDPSCESESLVSDPDFSRLGPLMAGSHHLNGVVRRTLVPPESHDERSIEIDALPCAPNPASTPQSWFDVATRWPKRSADSGPAVRFVYKTRGNPTGFVGTPSTTFSHAPSWTPFETCIEGSVDGTIRFLRIGLLTCGDHALAVDELEVYADPACGLGR